MPASGGSRLFLVLLLPLMGVASAKDLSKYPCTVFSSDVCFRLPTGTHLDYSVPADFDLYKVSKDAKPVATVYIGNAPQTVDSSASPRVSNSAYGTVKVYSDRSTSGKKLDIYITPKAKDASTVHISADLDPSIRNELIDLLSSFRPCKAVKSGGQKCPLNDTWGRELAKELSP